MLKHQSNNISVLAIAISVIALCLALCVSTESVAPVCVWCLCDGVTIWF